VLEVAVPVATLWSAPDAPREVDAPALWDRPDPGAWTSRLDAAGRTGLVGRTLTQCLLGEPVQVRSERGEWVEVRLPWQESSRDPAGYPGWMRRSHLAEAVQRQAGATAYVVTPMARLHVTDGPPATVSLGTVLWSDGEESGEVAVRLPGGRRGRLLPDAVRRSEKDETPAATAERVLRTGRSFLGLRYLWGGLSSWGVDCSGLVHLTLRSLGLLVPRDAHDQQAAFPAVPVDAVRPGDLYFFGADRVTHVGVVSDRTAAGAPGATRPMLHAPERDGGGLVEEAELDDRRRRSLLGAGRPRLPA
jgi:cell wall-associated NlpC family hydrolase